MKNIQQSIQALEEMLSDPEASLRLEEIDSIKAAIEQLKWARGTIRSLHGDLERAQKTIETTSKSLSDSLIYKKKYQFLDD